MYISHLAEIKWSQNCWALVAGPLQDTLRIWLRGLASDNIGGRSPACKKAKGDAPIAAELEVLVLWRKIRSRLLERTNGGFVKCFFEKPGSVFLQEFAANPT